MSETVNGATAGFEGCAIPGGNSQPGAEAPGWTLRPRWLLALGGLIAGLAAFLIGEATYELIPAEELPVPTSGTIVMAATAGTTATAVTRNAALAFASLGGCLGLCLGLAGGLARRSGTAAAAAGFLGLLLGAAAGAGVTLATLRKFLDAQPFYPDYEIFLAMGMHGLTWGLPAAVAGLAFAVGVAPSSRRLLVVAPLAGLLGAVAGAVAFDLAGAIFLPLGSTGDPVSTTWPSRLAARLVVSVGTAAGLIMALSPPRRIPTAGGASAAASAPGREAP